VEKEIDLAGTAVAAALVLQELVQGWCFEQMDSRSVEFASLMLQTALRLSSLTGGKDLWIAAEAERVGSVRGWQRSAVEYHWEQKIARVEARSHRILRPYTVFAAVASAVVVLRRKLPRCLKEKHSIAVEVLAEYAVVPLAHSPYSVVLSDIRLIAAVAAVAIAGMGWIPVDSGRLIRRSRSGLREGAS
jgi:hypothetical protein